MKLRKTTTVLLLLLCAACSSVAQNNVGRGAAETMVGGKKVKITYGRPSLKGRNMLGMATVGTVWRVGMNEATEIESAGNLWIAGKELKAGKYSLWAKKTGEDSWVLAFHPKTGVWGAPPLRDGYVAELPLKMEKAADESEQLAINLGEKDGEAVVKIHWGATVMSGSFGVK